MSQSLENQIIEEVHRIGRSPFYDPEPEVQLFRADRTVAGWGPGASTTHYAFGGEAHPVHIPPVGSPAYGVGCASSFSSIAGITPTSPVLSVYGYRVIACATLKEQFRFPRSKKRRIRKKSAKREKNWRPSTMIYMDHERKLILCHPSMLPKLRQAIEDTR